ncbi:MAG TPA: DUF882 domain-containing protein [Xanthobacteraceae bacterium]|nr:DUF882 domain-containing protein [Xanthobacteraceae bacterium]
MTAGAAQRVNVGTPVPGGVRLKTCRIAAGRIAAACGFAALVLLFGARCLQNAIAEGDTRTISLHHVHTGEDITITFKNNGRYDEAALEKLNWFLRDWRKQQETKMDPHLIDLAWEVQRETGSKQPIWVVCGYRSPETNAMLRRRSGGVARFSQHMLGHAMDFYIPGVNLEQLREIGLRLQRGGVGFYPSSGSPFVHLDTGGVRMWPRMSRDQLMHVFPDGRTVHIPNDGRPLAGYALALADVRAHGGTPSELLLEQAHNSGVAVADNGLPAQPRPSFNPFAKLLGLAHDEEDEDASAPVTVAANTPAPAREPLRLRAKAAVVAAVDRAEDKLARAKDKLAAEKVKLAKATSKVHFITRAEAAPAAALTPNQIILARGFWPDAPVSQAPAAPEATGSLNPLATAHDNPEAPQATLAYAEFASAEPMARAVSVTSTPLPRIAAAHFVPVQTADNATTIAVKRVNDQSASAILSVANQRLTPLSDPARLSDPWLRAIVTVPELRRSLSTTSLGTRDIRTMAALMVKPESSVVMTFAADPSPGLAYNRFSGNAIVFLSIVTYPLRTAALQ